VDTPFRTRTTRETEGLACPPMVVPTESRDGLRARPADEPKRTQTGRQLDALTIPPPFLALLRSGRPRTIGIGQPLATVVANGSNHGLAVPEPFVTLLRNHCAAAGVGDPLATVVAAGNHHGLTVPPGAMLVPYYGTAVAHPVSEPAGTVTTRDRHALVTRPLEDVGDEEVDACTFRMLTPAEIGLAMAFPGSYLMRGSKRDRVRMYRVRMYGNAVTPPAARLIVERLLAALAGRTRKGNER
jgi:DNA (cytosine-5)-methyltransferase 1